MTREEFTGLITGYGIKKIPVWNAEEDTPIGHLNNYIDNLRKHILEVEKVLGRNKNDS